MAGENSFEKSHVHSGSGGIGGGAFGAGVMTELDEAEAHRWISGMSGASAGNFNNGFFLAGQAAFGSRIYWEDMPRGFITKDPRRLFTHSVLGMQFLKDVITYVKPLDVQAIKDQPIPFGVNVYDTALRKVVCLDGKVDTVNRLVASATSVPYGANSKARYVDAAMVEPIGLDDLRRRSEGSRLVIILNHPLDAEIKSGLKNLAHGIVGSLISSPLPLFRMYVNKIISGRRDIKDALADERISLITPPSDIPAGTSTTDPRRIRKAWEMGRRTADQVLAVLEDP